MSGRGPGAVSADVLAGARGLQWQTILAGVIVATWAVVALALHDGLYDIFAVIASIVILGAAAAFFIWEAPPGREAFKLLGFFVCGQAFISSGMGVLLGEDEEFLMVAPTTESFSFAVQSSVVFALVFLLGAFITAPHRPLQVTPEDERAAGPTPLTATVLASIVTVYSLALATGTGSSALERLGMVPLVLFNPELILPLFMASRLLTRRRMTIPLALVLASQIFVSFITSMLGVALLAVRDTILANVFLRKPLPLKWIAIVTAVFVLLNPAKHAFRQLVLQSNETVDTSTALSFWSEAINTSMDDSPRRESQHGVDSTVKRLNYNSMSAHVYTMLEGPLAFEEGGTYEDIPTILIPRALYPSKPTSVYMRGRWLIKLGLQSRESVQRSSFAVPASAEAYWNFGWLGVAGVPLVLGLVVGLFLHLAPQDPVARSGFTVLAVVLLGQFLDMLVWVIPQFLAVLATALLVRFYSRIGKPAALLRRRADELRPSTEQAS